MKKLFPLAGILVFLAVWEAGVRLLKVPAYLMPPPSKVFLMFVDEYQKLAYHGWVTTYEMLLGYALAVAVAIPLAIAMTASQRFDRFVTPQMLFFQVVPKVAIAPLFRMPRGSTHSPTTFARPAFTAARSIVGFTVAVPLVTVKPTGSDGGTVSTNRCAAAKSFRPFCAVNDKSSIRITKVRGSFW